MNDTLELNRFLHELKNPLTICNGYLEIIDKDSTNISKYLKIINSEIKRSLNIISDFTTSNKLNIELFDLSILFDELVNTLDKLYLDNNIYITTNYEEELLVEGDYEKLKQVFLNVLKNSYEAKDKNILLINIKIEELKDYYKIIITDNGCGISKSNLNNIYDDYYTTKSYGTGLGIPYIKKIISMHSGNVSYKSIEGKGTTVIIKLKKS